MKKIIVMTALLLVCAGLVCAQSGIIKDISGTVELKKAGASVFVPAKAGDALNMDTIISTGFRSTSLVSAGSSMITVRPLTRLSLAELSTSAGNETINVNLQSGRVRVDVNPPAGTRLNMRVRGPSATASVRGTAFDFDTRNVSVSHGVVAFQGTKGAAVLLSAGEASSVAADGKTDDPIETAVTALIPPPPPGMTDNSQPQASSDVSDLTPLFAYE